MIVFNNWLLASVPDDVQARLFNYIELVEVTRDQVLFEPDCPLDYAYFPDSSIVSLLYELADGSATEVAMIGDEGMLGISVFMGGRSTSSRAVVIKSGRAYRIPAKRVLNEFNRHGEMLILFLSYTQSLISQMAQTAICNRRHSLTQQLCRFFLLFLDRSHSNKISITQDVISQILGVRREGVTSEAGKLQRLGAIEYHRGNIIVHERGILEKYCCECYESVKQETERLFPGYNA